MGMDDLDIVGAWPEFQGKTLEGLVVQEAWFEGECDDEANVVWLHVDGDWYKLYFDGDAVFWKAHSSGPDGRDGGREGTEQFPLTDLAEKHGLAGTRITACDGDYVDDASEITVQLDGNRAITFRNRFDHTTVLVDGPAKS